MNNTDAMFYITCTTSTGEACGNSKTRLGSTPGSNSVVAMNEVESYMSEEEETFHLAISTTAASRCVRRAVDSGSLTSDVGSDGVAINSPLGTRFDSSEWTDDDDNCFVDEVPLPLKESFRKSWTDSGVSSTRTDSQPGSLVNRVKRSSQRELNSDFQDGHQCFGSPQERRSLRDVKRSQKKRQPSSRDKAVRTSWHADKQGEDSDRLPTAGLPACDGSSTLLRNISTWTPKEREILCQVFENARDLGVARKLSPPTKAKHPKEASKKTELMDYPLSKYRNTSEDGQRPRTPSKSGKSLMSGLRKLSQGLKRRKDSSSCKQTDPISPQDIVYQDYISRYLDPSDESDMSDDESDELSRLGIAPKKTSLFKRVFQRRSSRTYLASSGAALKSQRHLERSSSATPKLRRERSTSTRSIPDSFRGLFSRSRAHSVESLQCPRRRMSRSRSSTSLAFRPQGVPSSQRFGGSSISLANSKVHRRYDSVRSLLQPNHYDIATHVLGDQSTPRQPVATPCDQYNLENVRRRRMSSGQRSLKGYALDDFFPTAVCPDNKPSSYCNDSRCGDVGYESCYDDNDENLNSLLSDGGPVTERRLLHGVLEQPNETVIAPLEIRVTEKKMAAKRQLGYTTICSFV